MRNNELFVLNPSENNLLNDGVVNINTAHDADGLITIKHELKTFVCEGEYADGINRILDTYLKHVNDPKQPAVWVSGFFGSGKSHLIKMLKYYWEDFSFPDGETARSIKELPFDIHEKMVQLDRIQQRQQSLAISGTLKDFPSNDIRYSFLQLLLNSLDLPQQYHLFKFVYWAKKENIYDDLVTAVENEGKDFNSELQSLFVSPIIARTVLELKPEFAESEAKLRNLFKAQFTRIEQLDRFEFIRTIKNEILPLSFGDQIPCTIIVLDELQQFIGQDQNKTIEIQNLAQDVCDNFNGKFLLVGSGQNALSDTPQLSPLQDRFSVKVGLSDADVKQVTRKTVLEKKPNVIPEIDQQLENALGEISRNLTGSSFGYTTSDRNNLTADYPLLPSIRRFWSKIIQVIDTAGTSGQLRSQLRIVDESIKKVADRPLGHIVPGDFVFEQKQNQLLQNSILLNETNNLINDRLSLKGKDDEKYLEGRILSIIFLIGQLPSDLPGGALKSDKETIADLLISDLTSSSEEFRNQISQAIDRLADETVVMSIEDEYKLQTKIGTEWEQAYKAHVIKLNNNGDDDINQVRQDNFLHILRVKTKGLIIQQGKSKQKRAFTLWDSDEKPDTSTNLHVWIHDGWNKGERLLLEEIRAEGADAPLSYLYIPKEREVDIKNEIIKYLSAKRALNEKGVQNSLEGEQAYRAMETRMSKAQHGIYELCVRIIDNAKIYLAGGSLYDSDNFGENLRNALHAIADRQFYEFKSKADYSGWDKVLNKAIRKAPDALQEIGFQGDIKEHPAAAELLRFIGNSSKMGRTVRNEFMKAPYGWSQDAVDALLIALTNAEMLSASEADLRTGNINKAEFKKETHTLSASEKIQLRRLYQSAGINCAPGKEVEVSEQYLNTLSGLANEISGEPPLPEPVDTSLIERLRHEKGNARLSELLKAKDSLEENYKAWSQKKALLQERSQYWELTKALLDFLPPDQQELKKQGQAIEEQRLLFQEPDPVQPLLQRIVDVLNKDLKYLMEEYNEKYERMMEQLQESEAFKALSPEDKHAILNKNNLLNTPDIKTRSAKELARHLGQYSLDVWNTQIAALDSRFQKANKDAIFKAQPKTKVFNLPRRTLKNRADVQKYAEEIQKQLLELMDDSESVLLQ